MSQLSRRVPGVCTSPMGARDHLPKSCLRSWSSFRISAEQRVGDQICSGSSLAVPSELVVRRRLSPPPRLLLSLLLPNSFESSLERCNNQKHSPGFRISQRFSQSSWPAAGCRSSSISHDRVARTHNVYTRDTSRKHLRKPRDGREQAAPEAAPDQRLTRGLSNGKSGLEGEELRKVFRESAYVFSRTGNCS